MSSVVVGVEFDQPRVVLEQAVAVARDLEAVLVFGHVVRPAPVLGDPRAVPGGAPYAPDAEWQEPEWSRTANELHDRLAEALEPDAPEWRVEMLFGDPGEELGRLADRVDARLIVIGTRRGGFGRTLGEFFTGSIAVHLAHRQRRPVLVIPVHPVITAEDLPWVGSD